MNTAPRARPYQQAQIARLRAIDLEDVFDILGLYAKLDATYNPIRNRHSRRYHVSVNHTVYELLITEDKWYNCHTRTGGGGAIDLTMHLYREKFIQAVRRLDRGMKERTNTPSGYDYEKRSDHSWTHGA
jgi:hypothetical protein